MKHALSHFRPYRRGLGALALLSAVTAALEAGVIVLLVPLAQAVASGQDAYEFSVLGITRSETVGTLALAVVALAIGRVALQAAVADVTARLVAAYQADSRRHLLHAYLRASWPVQAAEVAGRLQDAATLQVERGAYALTMLCLGLTAGFSLAILFTASLLVNAFAAMAMVLAAALLFAITRPLSIWAKRYSIHLVGNDQRFAGRVDEAVTLAREIRVFGSAGRFLEGVDELVGDSRRVKRRQLRLYLILPTVYQNLALLLVAGGLYVIHWRTVGAVTELATIVLLLVRALSYAQVVQTQYHQLTEASPYLDTVRERIERYRAAELEASDGAALDTVRSLAFDHVSFAYEDASEGLREVTFEAERGDVVGIVGPSGAGKTTLVQLLLRLREPTSGRLLVNGRPLRDVSLEAWHHHVGFVAQEPYLLEDTVEANIAFFRPELRGAAVHRAAVQAHIDERIRRLPDGYDTVLRDFGGRLSGGERQRLCIARALASGPEVLVFDEPTASLDPSSAAAVQESLRELRADHLIFLVAHHPASLSLCTKVLVLEQGRARVFGSLADAERDSPYFRRALEDALATGADRLP